MIQFIMRFIITILIMSCTMAPRTTAKFEPLSELLQKQVWLDGCMIGIINSLVAQGIREADINIIGLTEACYNLTLARFRVR